MKTQIKTIIATTFAALVLTVGTASANANVSHPAKAEKNITTQINTVKRIAVEGNVEVLIMSSKTEGVAYAEDSNGEVKVMQKGNLLTISQNGNGKAKVIVYVTDIYRIQGSDDAVIKTDGKLKVEYLQIFLKDNASANINATTEGLYTVLANSSKLTLHGATNNHTMQTAKDSSLIVSHFSAKNTSIDSQNSLLSQESVAQAK